MSARILIVDDLATSVKVLAAKLTGEYYDVLTAQDGESALHVLEETTPDLVLLDVMMPGMDGFEVCRRIKANADTAHIPVVMVTALSDIRDRVEGLDAGADDFLTKPVDDLTLFSRVRSLVRMKRTLDQWRLHEETSRKLGFHCGSDAHLDMGRDANVVIVDTSDTLRANLQDVLSADHDTVHGVKSYDNAMANIAKISPDVCVLSMSVNDDTPLRLASQFRSSEETRHMPILLIGDEGERSELIKGLEIGVNDYIIRPVDKQEVIARVRTQVRRKRYQERLQQNFVQHLSMALTDPLTGLHNRRYLEQHLQGMVASSVETGKVLSLLMIDLDSFKAVNDTYGHAAGDMVLRDISQRVLRNIRGFDLAARFGGEEFVVAMPDTPLEVAVAVAERIRRKAEEQAVVIGPGRELNVTLSIGAAQTNQEIGSAEALFDKADGALYEAKESGRNRVVPAEKNDGHQPTEAAID